MEVGEHVVTFNMNEAMKYPFDNSAFAGLNAIDYAVEETRDEHELSLHDGYDSVLHNSQNSHEAFQEHVDSNSSLSAYNDYFESLSSVYSFSCSCEGNASCFNCLDINSMLSPSQDISIRFHHLIVIMCLQKSC